MRIEEIKPSQRKKGRILVKLSDGSILRLTEGNLAPVACLETEENACERCGTCPTLDFWTGLYAVVNDYVDRFTLADLVREELTKGGEAPISSET